MQDDETAAGAQPDDDAEAGWRVIAEQQARIAALRAAVMAGRVDEDAFDYAAFFGGKPDGDTPPS